MARGEWWKPSARKYHTFRLFFIFGERPCFLFVFFLFLLRFVFVCVLLGNFCDVLWGGGWAGGKEKGERGRGKEKGEREREKGETEQEYF